MGILKKWLKLEGLPLVAQRLLFFFCGLLIISMSRELTTYVHYVVGGMMFIVCMLMLVSSLQEQSYRREGDHSLPTAVVGVILACIIIVRQHGAIPFIAVAWGINGLRGGIESISHALYAAGHKEPWIGHLVHGLFETVLALMLVFDPQEKIGEHIVILGL